MDATRNRVLLTGVIGAALIAVGLTAYSPTRAGLLDLFDAGAPASSVDVRTPTYPAMNPTPVLAPTQAPNYRSIVREYGRAVVGITVDGLRKTGLSDSQIGGSTADPFFRFFQGIPGFPLPFPRSFEQPFHGQGSGVIISSDGLILTNAHVVRDAQDVTVKLADRREFKARVLGTDPATDIAVLRTNATGLPTVKFGDPGTLQVGDYVLAIGAPFGFDQSATAGIVSAKGRSLPGDSYVPFIQTDAAVNPGNSGGPLFDVGGNVVGINAQIYSQTGGYQGLSFAIPIDVALRSKDQIVATGHAVHARLGVMVQDLNQVLADSFGLSRPDGALISSVAKESPADGIGLKAGDVITEVDGHKIEKSGDLSMQIAARAPGARVSLQVWRDRSAREMPVTLAEAEPSPERSASRDSEGHAELGLTLRPLTKEEQAEASTGPGLLVEDASGPAALAGVLPGDVVVGVNGRPVRSLAEVRELVHRHPRSIALLVERDGQRIFVPVPLG